MAQEDFTEVEKPRTNFKEIGKSGTLVTGYTIINDYIQALLGDQGQEQYEKMLKSDSQIRKLYHAISNPIRSAKWYIEPASDDTIDLEAAALIEQILFCDLPDGWVSKLDEILSYPWHGHAVFEVVHKNRTHRDFGQYTGLLNLAFRDQTTLDEWKFSPEGVLEFIHQLQSGTIEVNVDIPAEDLLIFYNEKKGNDSGYPFCRMLYGNYKRKLLYKQLQAIGIEKGAIGVPILTLPAGVDYDSEEVIAAQSQLDAYTQAESAYIILPDQYELKLDQSNTFDPAKVQVAIKAENEEISGSLVAMWLEMGIGGNSAVGSSTSESVEFFRDGIQYIADKIKETINLKLIPNLIRLNFGDTISRMPELAHSGISDKAGEELMKIVTGYVKDGVITNDEPLEDHVRKVHNLPKKAEGERVENQNTQDVDPNPPTPSNEEDELNLSDKAPKNAKGLINSQSPKIQDSLRNSMSLASSKYINDVMNRYKQLSPSKKQNATNTLKIGYSNQLKKDLKRDLTDTAARSIEMARTEVPSASEVQLNNHERDMLRLVEKYGDSVNEIKFNEFSKLPAYIQVLIAKQAQLITDDTLTDLKKRIDFAFSSIETKSSDENVIRQAMEDEANNFTEGNQVTIKANNVSSLMVNEGRDAFFFEPEVLEEIHSFTFVNIAPVAAVCRELAGTTFNTNDAESLRYTPPLHHNCKSYLRANLKSSKGVDRLEISTLSPSANAKKSITL